MWQGLVWTGWSVVKLITAVSTHQGFREAGGGGGLFPCQGAFRSSVSHCLRGSPSSGCRILSLLNLAILVTPYILFLAPSLFNLIFFLLS